jgi:chromate transporter
VKSYLDLIWTFIRIGASTFGGGYAMIPVLERELIKKKAWITMEEVMDYYTIAQITPGIIAINISTFVGFRRKGIAGGILATTSFALPGLILMSLISLFISRFAEYEAVKHAFAGIRIAVGALVLDTVWKLLSGLFKKPATKTPPAAAAETAAVPDAETQAARFSAALRRAAPVIIAAAAFALSAALSASPVLIIAGAGILGFLLWKPSRPLTGGTNGEGGAP